MDTLISRRQLIGGIAGTAALAVSVADALDGLQPSNACADYENAGGSNCAGGGGEHGENSWQGIRGDYQRFVSADGGHGRKHIHTLCAGGARHQFDGKRGDVALGNLLNCVQAAEWAEKS